MLTGFGYDALFAKLPTEVNTRTETNKLYERMGTPKLLTDDQDVRDTELSMYIGGNGDYYIELKETKRGEVVKLDTRIAMSGGNATPEIRYAVSNLFKALMGQKVDGSTLFDDLGNEIIVSENMTKEQWNTAIDNHMRWIKSTVDEAANNLIQYYR